MRKVVIIGGGAAGFFAAINLASQVRDAKIVILEKTAKVLSKVKVSGGGRCNVTHACFDNKELIHNYPRGARELLSVFHTFSTADVLEWFADRGVNIKMEDDGRMFPESDNSQTIIDCFMKEISKHNISIDYSKEVTQIERGDEILISLKDGKKLKADYVIVSCGGSQKHKHYDIVTKLGIEVVKTIPSLFTFNLPKHPSNALMGLSVNAVVSIANTKYEEYGPVLFTHWGMSGPAILKLSSKAAVYLNTMSYQFEYTIEWLEDVTPLLKEMREKCSKNKVIKSKIKAFPSRLWEYFIERAGIDTSKNWADLNKVEMLKLTQVLEKDVYHANGKTTFKEEFVSCGGVNLKEINMKTMESKKVQNLYMIGEFVNVDALTGGFNFQAAWSTGYIAALSIARDIKN